MAERPKREGVMLAYPTEEGRVIRLGKEFFEQPKYKGERCRVEWFHGDPVLISSYGNQFKYLEHIEARLLEIADRWGQAIPFDGELYRHGWKFSKIHSVASRKTKRHPDCTGLQFHIFDAQILTYPQWKRVHLVDKIFEYIDYDAIQQVPTTLITREDWTQRAVEHFNNGYEGIILRSCQSYYRPKRDVGLLKFKPTETDEYTIITCIEAIDKYGQPKDTLGAFLVTSDEGTQFKVGAGRLKHDERDAIWMARLGMEGKTLIVKHEKTKTVNNVPECAVAVEVKGGIG